MALAAGGSRRNHRTWSDHLPFWRAALLRQLQPVFARSADALENCPAPLRWFIVDASAITNVDYTATGVICDVQKELATRGIGLALARVDADLKPVLDRHDLIRFIGVARIFDSLHEALGALRGMDPP